MVPTKPGYRDQGVTHGTSACCPRSDGEHAEHTWVRCKVTTSARCGKGATMEVLGTTTGKRGLAHDRGRHARRHGEHRSLLATRLPHPGEQLCDAVGQRPARQGRAGPENRHPRLPGDAQLLEPGLLRASFVPPAPLRELRELTRSRRPLIPEHAREVNRIQKVLDTAAKGRLRAKAAPFAGGFDRTGYPASRLPTRRPAEPRRVPRTADRALRFSEDPPRTLGEVIDHARQGQLAAEQAVRQK
jgi:hypothetical protein